jgi:hypothetical protein
MNNADVAAAAWGQYALIENWQLRICHLLLHGVLLYA